MCKPKFHGGLDIIDIEVWNETNMIRLLWNLSGKSDSLWVRWIQAYYMKTKNIMEVEVKNNYTWIMKIVLMGKAEWGDISR